MLALADGRPAHLTEVHAALTSLPAADQAAPRRHRGLEDRAAPAHLPAGRAHPPAHHHARWPDPSPTAPPPRPAAGCCDQLTEASIPEAFKNASTSLAADWTDVEAWSRPVPHDAPAPAPTPRPAGATATSTAGSRKERCSSATTSRAAVMVADENGPAVPELARRITVASPAHDPAAELAGVLTAHARQRHRARRHHRRLRLLPPRPRPPGPSRCAPPAPSLVQDLHPHDRGPQRHPPGRDHRQREPVLSRHPRATTGAGARCRPAPPPPMPPPTTSRPPNSPGTSSASTPPTTPTATAATPAPPPPGRSAARCARHR